MGGLFLVRPHNKHMTDQSHLDARYFVDNLVYNCPFCNRRHVSYHVYDHVSFDWSNTKTCKAFFVECDSCDKKSMHLTFEKVTCTHVGNYGGHSAYRFDVKAGEDVGAKLDAAFFYSAPTSFFVLDTRVPKVLRELLVEAEGCLKSNFLTGASACARKIVYELGVLSKAEGANYEDRIKSLKTIHPEVEPAFFDTLLTIQQLTSTKVHEQSFDGWEAKHLRVILASLSDVLHELYVVPALRADRRRSMLDLKSELIPIEPEPSQGGV